MSKTKVPIEYGAYEGSGYWNAFNHARSNAFPHAEEFAEGGCIEDTPTNAVIYVCEQCRVARLKWFLDHPQPK